MEPKGMDIAISKLNQKEWVHIFPEGKVSRDQTLQPFKLGVGKLVAEAQPSPVVIPFLTFGMPKIKKIGSYLPRFGHTVHATILEPLLFDDLIFAMKDRPRFAFLPPFFFELFFCFEITDWKKRQTGSSCTKPSPPESRIT
jgi:1-acyl-sn-glycerol-3-phosphate acyltransferase